MCFDFLGMPNHIFFCAITLSLKSHEPTRISTILTIRPITISWETIWVVVLMLLKNTCAHRKASRHPWSLQINYETTINKPSWRNKSCQQDACSNVYVNMRHHYTRPLTWLVCMTCDDVYVNKSCVKLCVLEEINHINKIHDLILIYLIGLVSWHITRGR